MTSIPKSSPQRTQKWASIADAAEHAGVSESTIRRRLVDGQLTGHRFGRRVLIDLDQLDALIYSGAAATDH